LLTNAEGHQVGQHMGGDLAYERIKTKDCEIVFMKSLSDYCNLVKIKIKTLRALSKTRNKQTNKQKTSQSQEATRQEQIRKKGAKKRKKNQNQNQNIR